MFDMNIYTAADTVDYSLIPSALYDPLRSACLIPNQPVPVLVNVNDDVTGAGGRK